MGTFFFLPPALGERVGGLHARDPRRSLCELGKEATIRSFGFLERKIREERMHKMPSGSSELILRLGERRRIAAVYVLVHEDDPTTMKRRIKSAQTNSN